MKRKQLSYFLLFLFTLVIAFPGYGQTRAARKHTKSCSVSAHKDHRSVMDLLNKCLKLGISNSGAIDEEKNTSSSTEEETDHGAETSGFLVPSALRLFCFSSAYLVDASHQLPPLLNGRDILSPPPNRAV